MVLAFYSGSESRSEQRREICTEFHQEDIYQRTRLIDVACNIQKLKWQWAGTIARQTGNNWKSKVLEWVTNREPGAGRHSVGIPPTK